MNDYRHGVYQAARQGRVEELRAALLAQPHCMYGALLLYAAAENGHVECIEIIVQLANLSIDTPGIDGRTPLYVAAMNGHVSAIETLVRLGSKAIDTPNNYGRTPLNAAARNGHISVIELLVRLGSKAIDTRDKDGRTPMHVAAGNGHAKSTETLFRLGSHALDTTDDIGRTPLISAISAPCARGVHLFSATIETLIQLGSQALETPNKEGRTPIFLAAHYDRIEALISLVGLGADRNVPTDGLTTPQKRRLQNPLTVSEQNVLDVRYRVYFGKSLVQRLLFHLSIEVRPCEIQPCNPVHVATESDSWCIVS